MNNTYEIYLISDSTGETLDRIFLALKAQFKNIEYKVHQYSFTRTENQILKTIDICKKNKNSIILYMKGTQARPMCGFSAKVVTTLNSHSVVFQDVNILEDPEIRVRLSEHSNWPTIPQLFVNGELIGGCDIVMEMESKGELKDILKKAV